MSDSTNSQTLEKDWKTVFLAALAISPNVAKAARAAGVNRSYTYQARKADPAFATSWDDVMEEALDDLEESVLGRAQKDDTTLAIFILKNRRRETYGEHVTNEHTGEITNNFRLIYDDRNPDPTAQAARGPVGSPIECK